MRSCKFFFKRILLLLLLFLLYQQFYLLYYSVILIPADFQKEKILNRSLERPKEIPKDYPVDEIAAFYDYFPSKISLDKLFVNGSYPFDDPNIKDLILHASDVFNFNCKNNTETVIFVISDPNNYLLRQDIRNSYGKNNVMFKYIFENDKQNNVSHCFIFSIGYRDDLVINQQVDFESFIHKDIIRIPIYDEYRKTANKIILTLYLLDKMPTPFKFVLKTDDDIFLKINRIIPLLHNLKEDNVFIGHVVHNSIPIRNSNNKWYVSEEDYPQKSYKPYMMGSCYIFRRTIIDTIAKKHYTVPLIPMEDIHISYLVTGSGYNLSDSKHFYHCISYYQCKDSYIVDMGRNLFRRKYVMSRFKQDFAYYNRTNRLLDYKILAEY